MIERVKDVFAAAQSFFTIAAIAATAIWFLFQHQCGPRLKIEHRVSHRVSARDPKINLLGVDVMLSNVGSVSVDLHCGHLRVLDVNPASAAGEPRLVWPENTDTSNRPGARGCLDDMTIEAGESDQVHEEIPLAAEVRTVRVRSFFRNPKGANDVGWEFISLYDLNGSTGSNTQTPAVPKSPALSPLN